MKQILIIIIAIVFSVNGEAQFNFESYGVFKKKNLLTKVIGYNENTNEKNSLIIENKLYLINSFSGEDVIFLDPASGNLFKSDSSNIYLLDKMQVDDRRKVIAKQLKKVEKGYSKKGRFSIEGDSIYEYCYSLIRNQITKSWVLDNDRRLLSDWFKFIHKNKPGDDALDAKFLTICFLKKPENFSSILKKQKSGLSFSILNYMTGSSGLQSATNALNMNYEEKLNLFKSLTE